MSDSGEAGVPGAGLGGLCARNPAFRESLEDEWQYMTYLVTFIVCVCLRVCVCGACVCACL
uniref:Uncharacterized protein n=1 Tax=Anguilla anguilla TaxID=7936 RepID=A0A0E9UCI6_ANGAN